MGGFGAGCGEMGHLSCVLMYCWFSKACCLKPSAHTAHLQDLPSFVFLTHPCPTVLPLPQEIAVRGAADSAVKQAAVRLLTEQLLPGSPLWPIYGERWREPRYYSLLMQVGRLPGVMKVLFGQCAAPALNASLPFSDCVAALHHQPPWETLRWRHCIALIPDSTAPLSAAALHHQPRHQSGRHRGGASAGAARHQPRRRCARHAPLPHFRAGCGQGDRAPSDG